MKLENWSFENPPLFASISFCPDCSKASELKSSCNLIVVCLWGFTSTLFISASYATMLLHPSPNQGFITGGGKVKRHVLSVHPLQAWSHSGFSISIYILTAAAAAKSLQSCLTLCDPIDGSPPGSPTPGILTRKIKKASLILPRGVCVSYSVMSDSLQSHGL